MFDHRKRENGDLEVNFIFNEEQVITLYLILKGVRRNPSFDHLPNIQKKAVSDLYTGFEEIHSMIIKEDG